jgi:hypothetical protein
MGMIAMKIKSLLRTYKPMALCIGLFLMTAWLMPAFAQETQKEAKYEAGFYYTVKKGDRLWDISQRFNDTPWQWPDLWKENDQLPNPHWIYPGERIRLYRKSDKHRYQEEQKQVPAIQPSVEASTPEPMPAPEVHFYYPNADTFGFIRKPPVDPKGTIFKSLEDKVLVSHGDLVYIQSKGYSQSGDFAAGSRYTIYRTLKPVDTINAEQTIGTQHLLIGALEVTRSEPQYAIARIIDVYMNDAVRIGDLLMPYKRRSPEIKVIDSTPGIEAKIIATEGHDDLVGSNITAFIDKGERDNILPGQQYSIYYQETETDSNGASITLAPVDVGSLIVLHTEATTSTVFISSARGKITPGFKVRTP